jgi:hypothetical protein
VLDIEAGGIEDRCNSVGDRCAIPAVSSPRALKHVGDLQHRRRQDRQRLVGVAGLSETLTRDMPLGALVAVQGP